MPNYSLTHTHFRFCSNIQTLWIRMGYPLVEQDLMKAIAFPNFQFNFRDLRLLDWPQLKEKKYQSQVLCKCITGGRWIRRFFNQNSWEREKTSGLEVELDSAFSVSESIIFTQTAHLIMSWFWIRSQSQRWKQISRFSKKRFASKDSRVPYLYSESLLSTVVIWLPYFLKYFHGCHLL